MKKGFLARRVEEVRRGPTGFDFEEFAKRPTAYLQQRKAGRVVPTPNPAARESLYAEVHVVPGGLKHPVRSHSLTEDRIGRAEKPSPPNSLPPIRRRFGPNATHSVSSAEDVFGSACDLPQGVPGADQPQHKEVVRPVLDQPQQLYLDMSATRTVESEDVTVLGVPRRSDHHVVPKVSVTSRK